MPKKITQEEFIEKLKEKYGDAYDYSRVEYAGNRKKVCLVCKKHGEFWKRPDDLLTEGYHGCQRCSYDERALKAAMTTEEFIEKARNVHGDKYDYSKTEYKNWQEKVIIICPKHGEFRQKPNAHLNGNGCPECFKERQSINTRNRNIITQEEFIEKARKIHGDKYDYSKVVYVDSHTKVVIICPKHGEFKQSPNNHLRGHGCPKCSSEKIAEQNTFTTQEFIERARKVHGDRYDYSKVIYLKAKKKVCIICPEHGEFLQTPDSHLRGNGCPKCNKSHLERLVFDYLTKSKVEFEEQKEFDWLVKSKKMPLDFYLPIYNTAIECQGEQHYKKYRFEKDDTELRKRQDNDALKRKLCEEHNVKITYVKYDDDVEKVLTEILSRGQERDD